MNMRRILKQPTLRMQAGGEMDPWLQGLIGAGAEIAHRGRQPLPNVRVPTGPGMDRAGFLQRNPQFDSPMPATPNPALAHQGFRPQPAPDTGLRGNNPSAYSAGAPAAPFAGAGRGNVNPPLVDPNVPLTPPTAGPGPGIEMKGNPGVFKHGSNSFSDSATAPVWSNTGKPSAENDGLMAGVAQRSGQPPTGWKGQSLGMNTNTVNPGMEARGNKPLYSPGLRDGGELCMSVGGEGPKHEFPDGLPGHARGLGGEVDGPKGVDKVPSFYTDKEFVASNAMLNKDPGLRGYLHELREQVLAEKGMTPEQADAKAVGGKTLRAFEGGPEDTLARRFAKVQTGKGLLSAAEAAAQGQPSIAQAAAAQPKYTPPPVNPATGGYTANERIIQSGAGAGQAGQTGSTVKVGGAAPSVQAGGAGAGSGGRAGVLGSVREGVGNLRAGLGAQPGPVSKSAFLAGRVLSSPLVAGAGKIAGAAGVVQNFNDYKLNEPDVDSTALGTLRALGSGDFSQAGRSLRKGAVEAGMDLGSFAANTADYFVPGDAPVSTAYNRMLHKNLGDQLIDNSGSGTGASAAPAQSATKPTLTIAGDATMPGEDPGRQGLREPVTVDWAARKAERDALTQRDIALGNQMQADRLEREKGWAADRQAQIEYNRDAGERWERQKGLRVGQSDYGSTKRRGQDMELRAARETIAKDIENNKATNQATLRGQNMTLEGARLTNQASSNRLQYDMAKDERTYKDSRYDKHLEQDGKASDQAGKAFEGLFDSTDKDGKVIRRTDLEAQANLVAKRASGGKWGTLNQAERDKHVGNAHSYVSILDSARKHQNNGWMQALGVDSPDAPRGGLPTPEELGKGKLERVGIREGATTPNASKGDWAIRLPNGQVMYLGSNLSGEHLKYLQDQGVK